MSKKKTPEEVLEGLKVKLEASHRIIGCLSSVVREAEKVVEKEGKHRDELTEVAAGLQEAIALIEFYKSKEENETC